MTKEEIMQLEGRELDAEVAKVLFGWQYGTYHPELKNYSSDMNAAWEVEEKAAEKDKVEYIAALMQVVWDDVDYISMVDPDSMTAWKDLYDVVHATPAQRCRAALLCMIDKEG